MLFAAPLWLTLLVPWAALAAWLWRRTDEERATTASFLWRTEAIEITRERSVRRRPAWWIVATLVSLFLMILGLGDPTIAGRRVRLAVVVDGSVALSSLDRGQPLRDRLLERVQREFESVGVDADLTVCIAGTKETFTSSNEAKSARFTARPTASAMDAQITSGLAESDVVVALSDRSLPRVDDRMIGFTPDRQRDNVGITTAVAVSKPMPSLMVRISNFSERSQAKLRVTSGDWSSDRVAELPPRGAAANVFVDLPTSVGEVIEVSLIEQHDDFAIDDHATLLRTQGMPRLVVDGDAPPIATRFAAAFGRASGAPEANSSTISIGATGAAATTTSAQIFLPCEWPLSAVNAVTATAHPLLRDVDLAASPIHRVAALPAGDWAVVARAGDIPLIAVRETTPHAVWIGFELDPETLRSIVLLNNAVDWLTDASPVEWRGETPEAVGEDWKPIKLSDPKLDASPGRYTTGSGRAVAINMRTIGGEQGRSAGNLPAMLLRAARDARHSLAQSISLLAACTTTLAVLLALQAGIRDGRLSLRRS